MQIDTAQAPTTNQESAAFLLAVVEVDKKDRVLCQVEGCGHSIFKRVHVMKVDGAFKVLGSDCFKRMYGHLGREASTPQYGSSDGRHLTDDERLLLIENTARFIEQLEIERIEYERIAALKAAEREHQAHLDASRLTQVSRSANTTPPALIESEQRKTAFNRTERIGSGVPHWIWRASWPTSAERCATAQALLVESPFQEILFEAAQTLSAQNNSESPLDYALLLEERGVPRDITLEFLVHLGLALKGFRPR